jgi:hypothetical protein
VVRVRVVMDAAELLLFGLDDSGMGSLAQESRQVDASDNRDYSRKDADAMDLSDLSGSELGERVKHEW